VADEPDEEVPLPGGHMNTVVRVGDTVRRTTGPWTPTIHALLRHIRANGFTLGPEPLGIDERGREILTFVPGESPASPPPGWVFSDATLDAVGAMVRAYHAAVRGFVAPTAAVWQLPVHEPAEVVCHNDIAPYNLVFDDERLCGVIDWDVASPGPRVWDLAYVAYRFVPLVSPDNPDIPNPGEDELVRRLARLCAVYAAADVTSRAVLDTTVVRLRDLNAFMHREAAAGNAGQQAIIDRGRGRIYDLDAAWLEAHADRIAPGPR
jgi:phosphotransferase family enzyme